MAFWFFSLVFYDFKYAQFQWNVQIQERFFRIKTRKYKKRENNFIIGKLDSIFANGNLYRTVATEILKEKPTIKN